MGKSPTVPEVVPICLGSREFTEAGDGATKRPKPEVLVAGDSSTMIFDPEVLAAGDSAAKHPKPEEEVAGDVVAKHPKPEEEVVGDGVAKHPKPEEEVVGDGWPETEEAYYEELAAFRARLKRPSVFDFDHPEWASYYQEPRNDKTMRVYHLLKVGKKIKKKMVRVKQEEIEYLLQHPHNMAELEEMPEGFDELPEVFRSGYLESNALVKKIVKEEQDIVEQYRTKGYAEIEVHVIE